MSCFLKILIIELISLKDIESDSNDLPNESGLIDCFFTNLFLQKLQFMICFSI
mgnify:CR=1 FL=1